MGDTNDHRNTCEFPKRISDNDEILNLFKSTTDITSVVIPYHGLSRLSTYLSSITIPRGRHIERPGEHLYMYSGRRPGNNHCQRDTLFIFNSSSLYYYSYYSWPHHHRYHCRWSSNIWCPSRGIPVPSIDFTNEYPICARRVR